jgi:cell wall assembly regulator SMI1
MHNNLLNTFYKVNDWFKQNYSRVYDFNRYKQGDILFNELAGPTNESEISQIETMLSIELPTEIKTLLVAHNGEVGQNSSPFFEQRLVDIKEIKEQIEFGLSLVKSSDRYIKNTEVSNDLIGKITTEVKSKLVLSEWYKIDFQGGDTFRMPSIYKNQSDLTERINVRIDHQEAARLIKLLKEEEKPTYDWDDIEFTVYPDGRIKTERKVFDWNSGISGSNTDHVKPIYFHSKWIALFGDGGGNYIGIDLDPGLSGTKGQVIIYGRDIYENLKLADNLEQLFDKILSDIQKESESIILNSKYHIHERLKRL